MKELESKTGTALPMANDYGELKAYLQEHLRASL